MSSAKNKANPWTSLADLLIEKVDVASLATAIEKKGISCFILAFRFYKNTIA